MRMRFFAVGAMLLGGLALPTAASAQSAIGEIKACTWIQEDAERLACFDAAARKLSNSAARTPSRGGPAFAAPAGRDDDLELPQEQAPVRAALARPTRRVAAPRSSPPPQDRFGLPEESRTREEEEEEEDTREMTIARAEMSATDKLLLTMDNGQVWMQADTQSLPPIDAGMTAVVREGFIGGYRLSVSGRTFRVKRVDRAQASQDSADTASQTASEAPRSGRRDVVSAPSSASPPPQDRFGLPEESRAREEEEEDTREMTIARAEMSATDKLLLTMDNGQVWMQTDTQSLPPIDAGMTAVVREGFIGGYRLSVSGRTFRVKRLQ